MAPKRTRDPPAAPASSAADRHDAQHGKPSVLTAWPWCPSASQHPPAAEQSLADRGRAWAGGPLACPAALCLLAAAQALALSPLSFLSPSAYLCGKRGFRVSRLSTKEPIQRRGCRTLHPMRKNQTPPELRPQRGWCTAPMGAQAKPRELPFPKGKVNLGAAQLCTRTPTCTHWYRLFSGVENRYAEGPSPAECI